MLGADDGTILTPQGAPKCGSVASEMQPGQARIDVITGDPLASAPRQPIVHVTVDAQSARRAIVEGSTGSMTGHAREAQL